MNHFTRFTLVNLFRFSLLGFFVFHLSNHALAQCPTIQAILVDACGTEQNNEFVVINSGGGFNTSDLQLSFDASNNIGNPNNDINIDIDNMGGTPCGLQPGNAAMISSCPNVVSVGPGVDIPANSTIVLLTSSGANLPTDFSAVCGGGECIYVIQSTCFRVVGGFTNSAVAGSRETILALSSGGCFNSYVYNLASLIGGGGAYFIPPGTYGNNGCDAPPVSAGPVPPDFDNPGPQVVCGSYTLPAITGTNLTGNEAYYQLPNGMGGQLLVGQTISSSANIFIFDPTAPCSDEEVFTVTITPGPTANTPASPLDVCVQVIPPSFTENLSTVINEITGGNPSLMVNWYTDVAGTNPFDPTDVLSYPVPPTTITIYATVDDGSCESATVPVTVNVNFFPTATAQSLTACDDGTGQATFDLTTLDNSVSPGNMVTYYTNAGATNVIGNPGAYVSSGGTVYATATNAGGCTSQPVMITLDMIPALTTANTSITINPTSACGGATINVTFNFPASGTYDVVLEYTDATNGTQSQSLTVTGMNPNPVNIPITETTTFSLVSASYNGTTCVYPFNPPGVETATITSGPIVNDIPDVTQCGPYTLPAITGTNLSGSQAFYSGSGGTGTQFLTGQVISGTTTLFIFDGVPGCTDEESFNINISPVPNLTVSGTLAYCEGQVIDLSNLVNDVNNSGFPITFHSATPANAGNQLPSPTVSPTTSTTYYALIDGPTGCFDEVPISITITPTPTAQTTSQTVCATSGNMATFDLTALNNTVSGGTGTVNWFQDIGLSNPIGNPAAFTTGSTTVFATVTSGSCSSAPVSVTLTVNPAPTVMTIAPQQICGSGGGAIFDLTTLENSIHNGTANQVTWYSDINLTNPIGNPSAFSTTGITVYMVASFDGCDAAPIAVELIVTDTAPPTQPTSPSACDNGSGQATFDLTLLESQMNVPAGFQVNWFSNPPPSTPIANPANYTGTGPVYATISQASCESTAITIALNILPVPTANPVDPITICDNGSGQALVNLTDYDLQINGGSGTPVIWYQDAGGNFPIGNPNAFMTGSATVFAIVDNGACTSPSISLQIMVNPSPLANDAQLSTCNQGTNQATFNLTQLEGVISNGTGSVSWFLDPNGNTPIGNPGVFTTASTQVYAIVANGFCTSQPATVTLTINEIPAIIPVPTLVSCNGANDGTLSILVNGGQMPYIFDWSNDIFDGATDLTDLSPGVYSLTVTDANLCEEEVMVTITQPDALVLNCAELAPVTTQGGNDGQAEITITGGTAPYDISYTGPLTGGQTGNVTGTLIINNLEAGNYNLIVTDGNGCTTSCSFTITDPDCAINLMITGTNLSCNGGSDGTINLTINNAATPYTVDWSFDDIDGQESPTGLMAGIYTVTVTDDNACESTTSITLSQPPAMNITCAERFPISMPGANDGEAEITISGGNAPYQVSWTGPANGNQSQNTAGTFFITGLEEGDYTILITDNQDCTIECTFTINGPGCSLSLDISGTDPACYGDSTGSILLTVNNATPPYDVIWTEEQYDGMETLTNVPAGSYAAIVTDAEGCEASTFITLGQPDSLEMSCGELSPVSTPGGNDGEAGISVTGGTPPYQVSWTGPVSGSQIENAAGNFSITDLEAGIYEITITDDNGCMVSCDFFINSVNCTLSLDISGTDLLCNGDDSGTINLTLNNAAAPYLVDWNVDILDGQENPTGLAPGFYSVTVSDANSCFASAMITLSEPSALEISCGQSMPVSTPGGNDGTAEVTFNNGTPPYTISWSGPVSGTQNSNTAATVTIPDLMAGNYTVIVTDANDCTINCDFSINDLSCMISLDILVDDASCDNADDGKISVVVLDGNEPYTFDWTPDALDGQQNPNDLEPGTYTVIVTDEDGCSVTETVEVAAQSMQPMVLLSPGGFVCDDDCYNFTLEFTGTPPYVMTYNIEDAIGPINFSMDVLGQDTTIEVCVADFTSNNGFVTLNLLSIKDANCTSILTESEQVDFLISTSSSIDTTFCANQTIVVNNITYGINNPMGQEIITNGNAAGCDSIININLSFITETSSDLDTTICLNDSLTVGNMVFHELNPSGAVIFPSTDGSCDTVINVSVHFFPAAESVLFATLCPGDSLLFNGTVYNENNITGTEILPGASVLGCDSLVKVNLVYLDSSSMEFQPMLCPGEDITINGVLYDANNPSGVQVLEGAAANGCDSFLVVNVILKPEAIGELATTLCAGDSLIFNGTIYDANNTSGTEILPGASSLGCDSIVNVTVSFITNPVGDFTVSICPNEEIIVNGTTYNAANPTGTEVLEGASVIGCDSIVNVTLTFLPEPVGDYNPTVCMGESIVFNGTTFDANNPSGSEILQGASVDGCDSTVNVTLAFLPEPVGVFNPTVCFGESIVFNGTTFDANNPSGSEVLQGASVDGCDSTVNVTLAFLPEPVGVFNPTVCFGESIVFNGTTFDANNPSGSEILQGASVDGCDSTVNVTLAFLPEPVGVFNPTVCFGESIVFNGTTFDANNPSGSEILQGASVEGCDSTVNVTLAFLPEPIPTNLNPSLCNGESITINGTLFDANNPSGTEILEGAGSNGCDSIVNVSLDFLPTPEAGIEGDISLCGGETTTLIFRLIGGAQFDLTYTDGINPPVTLMDINDGFTIEVNPDVSATYNILSATVVGSDCPVNITTGAEIIVSQLDVIVDVTSDYDGYGVSCENIADGTAQAEAIQGVGPYSYVWSNGNLTAGQSGLSVGSYTVLVTDATGCEAEGTITLEAPPGIDLDFSTASPACFGDPTGTLQIDTITGGSGPYEYSLNGEFFQTVSALPFQVGGVEPGNYTLSIQDANDCISEMPATIPDAQQLVLNLGPDQEVKIGDLTLLEGLVNFDVASAQWTPTDSLTTPDSILTIATPIQSTTYTLTAVDANGCTISDVITLFVNRERSVYIPNIFTPNDDGVNDFFGIFGGKDVVTVKIFRIFDRWGNLMYENGPFAPNDMTYGWDGKFQGKPMNTAVFVYYAELEFVDGETEIYKGDITLMR
ncbi:MAG: hypothetical protein DHS20C18_05560 [Saprospiraceae bacterium]|nr:MAG: hypothetical protein DHS20C18_05560 [Saprospiraceae bacterium]